VLRRLLEKVALLQLAADRRLQQESKVWGVLRWDAGSQ